MTDEAAYNAMVKRALKAEERCRTLEQREVQQDKAWADLVADYRTLRGELPPGEIRVSREPFSKKDRNCITFSIEVNRTEDWEHVDAMIEVLRDKMEDFLAAYRKPGARRDNNRTPGTKKAPGRSRGRLKRAQPE